MSRNQRGHRRHGYALVMTVVFMTLLLSAVCLSQQRLASSLRLEKIQALREQRDQGSIHAMAQVLTVLETGVPPTSPYKCLVTVETPQGPRNFTATLTLVSSGRWQIQVAPNQPSDNTVPLPATFGAAVSVVK
jgi:hypothetical protein